MKLQTGVSCLLFFVASPVFADKLDDLSRRVEELETQHSELLEQVNERRGRVNTFLRDNISIGGFFEHADTGISGKNTKTQVASTANYFGLNINADFSSQWRFVSQTIITLAIGLSNPHGDPRATTFGLPAQREFGTVSFGAIPTQNYVEYGSDEIIRVQAGMGYTPFGFSFQQRELVLFIRRGGPQMHRTTGLVLPFWSGVHIYGSTRIQGHGGRWGYSIYSSTLAFNFKIPGAGVRTWWGSFDESIQVGVSTQVGKRGEDTYKVIGGDLRVKSGRWLLTSEYAHQISQGDDPWSIYAEPSVVLFDDESIILYVFGDYAESVFSKTGSGSAALFDPYKKWEYGGGINWIPTAFTRFRLGIAKNDYVGGTAVPSGQDRDYMSYDLSMGVAF